MDREKNRAREAYRRWYEREKDSFNARRRARYKKDMEYAEKQRTYARERKRNFSNLYRGRVLRTYHQKKIWAWKIQAAAQYLGTNPRRIRYLEKVSLIPASIFSESTRAYTTNQVNLIGMIIEMLNEDVVGSDMRKAAKTVEGMWLDDLDHDEH